MNKILLTLVSCFLFGITSFAEQSETVTGVIGDVECNTPTGFGTVQLRTKVGNNLHVNWYQVNSKPLCYAPVGKNAFLPNLGNQGIIGVFVLTEENMVNELLEHRPVDKSFHKFDSDSKVILGANDYFEWFLSVREYH